MSPTQHQLKPLPFDAQKLTGLSVALINSHHQNNYAGAVKNLNRVEQEIASFNKDTPAFSVAALREKELNFYNSKTLHERYFANLGGDGNCSGAIESALAQTFGSYRHFDEQFRAAAIGLGGGSGWLTLSFELQTQRLRIVSSTSHTQTLTESTPLLVLDLYEHSYALDFGAAVGKYVDAFCANVHWIEVNRRYAQAQKISTLLTE